MQMSSTCRVLRIPYFPQCAPWRLERYLITLQFCVAPSHMGGGIRINPSTPINGALALREEKNPSILHPRWGASYLAVVTGFPPTLSGESTHLFHLAWIQVACLFGSNQVRWKQQLPLPTKTSSFSFFLRRTSSTNEILSIGNFQRKRNL